MPHALHRTVHWSAVALPALVLLAYAPVFEAGFLNYDDPWLIERNPLYRGTGDIQLWQVLFDFSERTRLALGAEYLPLRDLLGWLEARTFGVHPVPMHVVSVGLYVAAGLLLRAALQLVLQDPLRAGMTALLFVLHPIHVESVAWLAGQKDVLALLFVAAALYVHARRGRAYQALVPLLVLCAALSKAMSVVVLVLLGAQDWLMHRRPALGVYLASAALLALALAAHVYTGSVVGMVSAPAGGSYASAWMTMGPVWLRYVSQCFWPSALSITYTVPDAHGWSGAAVVGYLLIAVSLLLSALAARRGQRLYLFAWLWFFAPLAPVSQVVTPLQNRMADRYAWLSVMAPCLLVVFALLGPRWGERLATLRTSLVGALALALAVLTLQRAVLFSDSILLFTDAALKDPRNPQPANLLAQALRDAGREREAMSMFREALGRRDQGASQAWCSAGNGLAALLVKHGQPAEAEGVLRATRDVCPTNPQLARNLAKLLRASGRSAEAEQLERQFPRAPPGRGAE